MGFFGGSTKVRKCGVHGNAMPCWKCKAIARQAPQARAQARKSGQPVVCGQRFASGGSCRATAPCGRDHSRH